MITAAVNTKRRTLNDLNDQQDNEPVLKRPKQAAIESNHKRKRSNESMDLDNSDSGSVIIGYRPPMIQLNALQRLELLKKRREKWRVSTLYSLKNFHSRGTQRSHPTSSSTSLTKYVEQSTQTDVVPSLSSKTEVSKSNSKNEAERKLKQGVFSGLLFYDPAEVDEGLNKSPVKFSTKAKKNEYIEGASNNQLGSLLKDGAKLIQSEVPKSLLSKPALTKENNEKPQFELPKISKSLESESIPKPSFGGPSAGFNFLKANTETTKINDSNDDDESRSRKKRTNGGLFDSAITSTPTISSITSNDKGSSLSFGDKKGESSSDKKLPSFNFGSTNTEKKEEKQEPVKSGSLFGSTTSTITEKKDTANFSLDTKTSESSKPSFSFGASVPKTNSEPSKPLFALESSKSTESKPVAPSFGAFAPAEKKDPAPTFAFGSSITTDKPAASSFTFGSTAKKDDAPTKIEEIIEPSKLNTFTAEKKDDTPRPLFGTDSSKPIIEFGAKTDSTEPKPAFSFGTNSSIAPAFGTTKSTAPVFSTSKDISNPEEPAKPLFGSSSTNLFGAKPTEEKKETSVFGSTTSSSKDKPAPAFSFGASSAGINTDSKPAFSFGSSAAPATASKPSFSFGQAKLPELSTPTLEKTSTFPPASTSASPAPFALNTNNTTQSDTKSVFNFGASATSQKPSDVFGASQPQQSTTSAFGFTSTPASSGSSTTSLSAFGQPAQPAATGFSFGSNNAAPAFGSNNNTTAPIFGSQSSSLTPVFGGPVSTGTPSSFNFGGAPTSADPSSIFTQAPAFGGAAAPGTPTQGTVRTQGRKIAQMRARRR